MKTPNRFLSNLQDREGALAKRLALLILAVMLFWVAGGAIPAHAAGDPSSAAQAETSENGAPQALPGGTVYVVRYGDTLSGIARRFGTTVRAIQQANGLTSTRIYAGQSLAIKIRQPDPAPGDTVYVVRYGDTLWDIARRFGTTVRAIVAANNLPSTRIYAGQRLAIPRHAPVPGTTVLSISPTSGPSGTVVQVSASGLPAHTAVSVGLGPQNSEFSQVAQGTTDGYGQFSVQVPVHGEAGMNWIFGVSAGDAHAISVPFHIK